MKIAQPSDKSDAAEEQSFRAPTRAEHRFGGALFAGFGAFFVLMYFLERGWWFSWFILGLGVISLVRGGYHLMRSLFAEAPPTSPPAEKPEPALKIASQKTEKLP